MSDTQGNFQVIEISPTAKYVVVSKVQLSMSEYEQLACQLRRWQKSDEQFLILSDVLALKRIDE